MAARVSPRRRCAAALLLCATLVLATACARAASIVVSGDVTQSGSTFNGDSITFDLASSSADVVTVQLLNSQVSGSGLSIQGYSGSVPSGVSTRVSMSVSATTVTSSTIAFTGVMPSNSDIRLATTTGTLGASQSLFDFSGLKLAGNVTVTVEDSSVSWPSGAANTGSIVTYSTGSTSVGIDDKSALFILNATATNGASVLHIATSSVFSVTNTAVLAIDYGRCDGCSSAMVDIDVPLQVDGSSMFRITQATVVNGNAGLLSSAGSVAVSDNSLYLISDSTIEDGSFFDFVTGADPSASTTTAFDFSVSTSSTVSFLNLVGPATGIPAGTHIPNTNDGTGVVNGGSCTIDGTALTTATEYQSNGIQVTEVVNSNGASSGTCANAQCVPGNSASGAAEVSGTACSCTCTASTFTPPSCISGSDPTQNYNNGATCTLANCDTCDRLYPSSRCSRCAKGYEVSSSTYQCQLINVPTTTTTAKPTTTTTTAKPTTTTTALCTVSYCAQCRPADGSTCTTCRNGYRLTGGSCIANINAASAAQSALLAAVVCAAAAVYTL